MVDPGNLYKITSSSNSFPLLSIAPILLLDECMCNPRIRNPNPVPGAVFKNTDDELDDIGINEGEMKKILKIY